VEGVLRKILALIILILVVLVYFAVFQIQPEQKPLGQSEATEFVLADLKTLTEKGADARVVETRKTDGTWEVDVLITQNPHSPCPTLSKRYYKLMPFSFRPEPIISNCNYHKGLLVHREEALINSAQIPAIYSFLAPASDAYGCAFKISAFDEKSALDYCKELDLNAFYSFSQNLKPDDWVVMWRALGKTALYALDSFGRLI